VTSIGVAFFLLDNAVEWNETSDKEKAIDYIFKNERIKFCNEAYRKLMFTTGDELYQLTPADFFSYNVELGKTIWKELLDSRFQPIHPYEINPGSWVMGTNQCLYDDSGRFIGHVQTLTDIPDKKDNENSASHELAFKKISIYQFCVMPDGTDSYIYISDEFKDIFGAEPEVLKNDASYLDTLIYFEDAKRVAEAFKASFNSFSILEVEFRIMHPEKGILWIKNTAMPEKKEDGRLLWNGYYTDITESKKADEWIEFLNTTLMNISDAVIITDQSGKIIYANRQTKAVHGYEPEELLGLTAEMLAEPLPEEAYNEMIKTIGEGKTFSSVGVSRRKDGSTFTCEFELTPVFDEKSSAYGMISIQRDITDRISMMEALKRSNERFEQLTKHSRAIAWEIDERGTITYINDASYDVLGYYPDEMTGIVSFFSLLTDFHDNELLHRIISSQRNITNFTCSVFTKKSSIIHLAINGIPVIDDNNCFKGYRGLGIDITEKTAMEQVIKNEEERYRTTLLSVGDGVISTDEQGKITVMNPVAEKLTGWKQTETIGKPFYTVFNIIDEATRKSCDNPVNIVLSTAESYKSPGTILLISKTGLETPIENNAAPIKNSNDQITGAVIVFRDFSDYRDRQKKIEYLSFHDPLTGLYNRRFMEDAFITADTKSNLPITVMVVDVNGLKLTNDAFGHKMGDNLLVTVAEVLKESCNPGNMIARMGGDEFVILMPKTGEDKAEVIKQKMIKKAAAVKLDSVIVSLAIGYSVKKTANESIENTIVTADNKMYREKLRFGKTMRSQTIETVLRNINFKYDREQVHTERVSQYCEAIASALGLHEKEVNEIKIAGALHDIGKTIIPPEILNKPGRLTKEEFDIVKRHPETGYQILKSSDEYVNLAEYVLYHHERWDGKGYPQGLAGREIPFQARIIAVADAFEAMTASRPYQRTKTTDEAKAELVRCSGTQLDPDVVKAFLEHVLN
jgi:diguanylate cyclase (GGDEF)-like protein/PAS domain S-box-containing protein